MTVQELQSILYRYDSKSKIEFVQQKTRSVTEFEIAEVSECVESKTVRLYLKKQ